MRFLCGLFVERPLCRELPIVLNISKWPPAVARLDIAGELTLSTLSGPSPMTASRKITRAATLAFGLISNSAPADS